jgi:hypothetical protein
MKELITVTRHPIVRSDGSLCLRGGYDAESKIFCCFEDEDYDNMPEKPTNQQIADAITTAFEPWSLYKYASDVDRGGMLAAIVTAVVRPTLDKCPGFFFEAALV